MRPRITLSLLSVGLFLAVMRTVYAASVDYPDSRLQKLDCIALEVRSADAWPFLDITKAALRDALLVGIKAKLPRLVIDPSCKSVLVTLFIPSDISTGRLDAAYGMLELLVERPVLLLETRETIQAEVWSSSIGFFHGPRSSLKRSAMNSLDEFINVFAAAYYRAGNR